MIKERIDKFYTDRVKGRERTHFYITDAGKCPRSVWFAFKKFPKKERDARVMRIFEHGDYTHMRIMSALFSIGAVKAIEVALQNELLHGRADGIVTVNNEPYVLELKSINSFGFKKLEQPKKEHVKQLMLYLHYFNIQKGIFLYENKDNQDLKEYMIEYDKQTAEQLISEMQTLKHFIENNILPPMPLGLEEWECQYCDYSEECRKRMNESRGIVTVKESAEKENETISKEDLSKIHKKDPSKE